MQGAQPRFPTKNGLVKASENVTFEVCADASDRSDSRVYRGDFIEVRHPVARLLAASPDLLDAAKQVLDHVNPDPDDGCTAETCEAAYHALEAAVAKAEGDES